MGMLNNAEQNVAHKMKDRFYRRTMRDAISKGLDDLSRTYNSVVMAELLLLASITLARIEAQENLPSQAQDG